LLKCIEKWVNGQAKYKYKRKRLPGRLPNVQNPLHTFPCNFRVDGEAANLTCSGETDVMDFGFNQTESLCGKK